MSTLVTRAGSLVIRIRWHYNVSTMRSLQQCLLDLDVAHLRYIARYWDLDETGRQHELAGNLAEAMVAPEYMQEAWEALTPDEKQALDTLLAASGAHLAFDNRAGGGAVVEVVWPQGLGAAMVGPPQVEAIR